MNLSKISLIVLTIVSTNLAYAEPRAPCAMCEQMDLDRRELALREALGRAEVYRSTEEAVAHYQRRLGSSAEACKTEPKVCEDLQASIDRENAKLRQLEGEIKSRMTTARGQQDI